MTAFLTIIGILLGAVVLSFIGLILMAFGYTAGKREGVKAGFKEGTAVAYNNAAAEIERIIGDTDGEPEVFDALFEYARGIRREAEALMKVAE